MSAGGSSQSRGQQSTKPTTISSKSGKTTAYAEDYEQHLIDHGIYPVLHEHPDARPTPKPSNLGDIRQRLAQSRASLSPSQFDESAFDDFQRKNVRAVREKKVMRTVVPVLGGNSDIPNEQDALFTKITAITDDTIPRPMPDYFDGARREDIHGAVKDELEKMIIPTGHGRDPALPNFFLEAKGHRGGADVAQRQACYDGAVGARAMHSLQNYGRDEPIYDGNAYALSSTYHAGTGTLQMYAHHPTKPTTPGGQSEYHMTQVKAYAMTSDRDACVDGLKAFRNGREWAKEQRDKSIEAANAKARGLGPPQDPETEVAQDEGSSPAEFVDCEKFAESQDVYGAPPLQHGPADNDIHTTSEDTSNEPALPQYLHAEDDAQDSQGCTPLASVEPSTSFATSFTSSFDTHQTRSKRQSSQSPPSVSRKHKRRGSANARTHPSTSRRTPSTQASASASLATTNSYWTWSDKHQNWYHLHEGGSCEWYKGKQQKEVIARDPPIG